MSGGISLVDAEGYGPTKQRHVGFVTEYETVYKVWRSLWTLHAADPKYQDEGSILARPKTLNISDTPKNPSESLL